MRHLQGVSHTLAKATVVALMKLIAMNMDVIIFELILYLALQNIATEATFNSMSQEDRKWPVN